MNGEVGFVLSAGTMRQDDDLLAPIDCVGSFGIDLSPTGAPVNPFLFNCADWNSTDALSRKSADMRIDLTRADAHLVLQPTSRLTVRAHARLAREDYRNIYLAYNPLTGHYGYIADNGIIQNPLLGQGYPSIGCRPCTSPAEPGSDARSGRWAGSARTECGIHG